MIDADYLIEKIVTTRAIIKMLKKTDNRAAIYENNIKLKIYIEMLEYIDCLEETDT